MRGQKAMKRFRVPVLLLVFVLLLAGCGGSGGRDVGWNSDSQAPGEPGYDYDDVENEPPRGEDGSYAPSEQKLIRTAQISLDVKDMDDALVQVRQITGTAGGFVSQSSVSGSDDNRRAHFTLRVPARTMDQVLDDIEAIGKRTYRETGDQDVTLHYVDLDARIRNAQLQEERLLEILEKAETIEDILRLEQELARVRGQLESMTAEFRYLSDRVDYATISVSLRETHTASSSITASGLKGVWQRGVAGLVNSVNAMLTGLGSFLVFALTALPHLVFLAVAGLATVVILKKIQPRGPRNPDA
jgi:hypothetical protein